MVKIALKVSYHSDETALSLLSRLAAANRIEFVIEFSQLVAIDYRKVASGNPLELRRLFELAGFDTDVAAASQPVALSPVHWQFSFGVLPSARLATSNVRFCPACLKADMMSGADKPNLAPYGRLSWLLTSFRTCPSHDLPLVGVPRENVTGNFLGSVVTHLPALPQLMSQAARASDFEAYLQRRIMTGKGDAALPDNLGMSGLMTISEAVGQVAEFGPNVRHHGLDEPALARSANEGFKLLQGGEQSLDQFLRGLEPEKEGARKTSVHRTWGRLYGVVQQYRGDDIEPVKAILRRAILRRYPKKVGTVVLDERVTSRSVHTLEFAAKAAGIAPKAARHLLQNDPSLLKSGANPLEAGTITDAKLAALVEVASRSMKRTEVTACLGIIERQFDHFSRYGIIKKMPGLKRRYDRCSVEDLLAKLSATAEPRSSPPYGTWSLVDAISARLSIRKAIDFVIEKRLDHIWYIESEVGLRRIWFDKIEFSKKLHSSYRA